MAHVKFPEGIVWAFNPNYIEIDQAVSPSATVTIGDYSISADLFRGKTKVYISGLLQILFDNPRQERVKTVRCSVREDLNITAIAELTVIWGALELGDRFSSYGAFCYDGDKVWQQRDVQFFVNYPFTLDLICLKGNVLRKRSSSEKSYLNVYNPVEDDAQLHLVAGHAFGHEYTVYRQDFEQPSDEGTFDMTFDHTFRTPKDTCVITRLHPRYEKEGYYLRWIDRFGFIEYYLFDAGDLSFKTSPSEFGVSAETEINGFSFEGHNHRYEIKTERSIKVCASNLDANTLEYVSSIVSSPVVDLYMGKTKEGTELWLPVHVSGGTYTYNTRHMSLRDFEITLELPNRKTQTL